MRKDSQTEIIDYQPGLGADFARLNREWLEAYFRVESIDEVVFANPEKEILGYGGEIFFAALNGEIVGTCALARKERPTELARMAVTQRARGLGLGELLAREAISRVREAGEDRIFLVTNTKLQPAIALYKKLGFQKIEVPAPFLYERANLAMELKFR